MKLTAILFLLFIGFSSNAQEIPFEKLEEVSNKISKTQLSVDGMVYNDGTADCQISFPEANFIVAFNSQLATNAVYKKSNGTELFYLSENISLARITGITAEIKNNNIVLYNLHFGEFTVTTKVFKDGELVDTTYKNNLILYGKYTGDETNSILYNSILEFSTLSQIKLGLLKKEKLDVENNDWRTLKKEDFVKKHPNSIRTLALKKQIEKKIAIAVKFLDSLSALYKIKIGASKEQIIDLNPYAIKIIKSRNLLFKDRFTYYFDHAKDYVGPTTFDFENNKLTRYYHIIKSEKYNYKEIKEKFDETLKYIQSKIPTEFINVTKDKYNQEFLDISFVINKNERISIFYNTESFSNFWQLKVNITQHMF